MANAARTRPDDPEDRILFQAVAELYVTFVRRGIDPKGTFPFFHCPNEGKVSKRQAAIRRRKGVMRGVGDLVIVWTVQDGTKVYEDHSGRLNPALPIVRPGAALELKARGKKPTAEQLAWLAYWRAAGFATAWKAGHRANAEQLRTWGLLDADQFDRWIAWAERNDAANV